MRYLLGVCLCLACMGVVAQQSSECNDLLTTIEKELSSTRAELVKALDSVNRSSATDLEKQALIESSKKSIERLEQKVAESDQITNSLKTWYQDRIRNLKELVSQLQERLKESIGLETGLEPIEKESTEAIQAAEWGLSFWRAVAISEVAIVVALTLYMVLK